MTREEAINKLKHLCSPEQMTALKVLVPELTESEDERTRKHIIELVKQSSNILCKQTQDAMIAYLEKQKYEYEVFEPIENTLEYKTGFKAGIESEKQKEQKEQKPVGWSDNFEENIRKLLHDKLSWHSEDGSMSSAVFINNKTLKDIITGIWFYVGKETLKYPNKELNVSEWSEEDEEHLDSIIESYKELLKDYKACHDIDYIPYNSDTVIRNVVNDVNFLKSLRPQPHWKPSEEQMEALEVALKMFPKDAPYRQRLEFLYNDLKKL